MVGKKKQRVMLRDQFGGACQACGYSRCTRALQFHHVDPSEKKEWSGKLGAATVDEIQAHPERFKLLCANCHFEEHEKLDRERMGSWPCSECQRPMTAKPHKVREGIGRYCSPLCRNTANYKIAMAKIPERIEANTVRTDSCWVWTGYTDNGSPIINVATGYKKHSCKTVARVVWELANGPLARELEIWKTCENLACIRLDHLQARDRTFRGNWLSSMNHDSSRNPKAPRRLDADTVRAIRSRQAESGMTIKKLAEEFGVTRKTIQEIVKRKTWIDLDQAQ